MIKKSFKQFGTGIFCLIFIIFTLTSCNYPTFSSEQDTVSESSSSRILKEQNSFDRYIHDLFVDEVTSNTISLHYTLSNPKSFGIQSYSISLGEISKDSQSENTAEIENIIATLSDYDYKALSTRQQLTYDILKDYCEIELSSSSLYYYNEPLRPTTGTHSQLPVLLAEYAFYKPSDVTDYLQLLDCIGDYFNEIITFEQEKSKQGLFMSDFAADAVIDACNAFTKNPEENYLIDTFHSRINDMTDIPEEKKQTYESQNRNLVLNNVIPAYEKLADALTQLKGTGKNEFGLCQYPDGKDYYEYLVKSNTGSNKKITTLEKMVEDQRTSDMTAMHTLLVENPKLFDESANVEIAQEDPATILEELQQKMLKDFMPPSDTTYEINYIDESLEDTSAPAFYLTAPIDDISHNIIYINKSSNYSGMQLFTTLAHEGYPGHLYQTTGSYQTNLEPVRSILNYPGYAEGWATYVEMMSYHYAGLDEKLADVLMYNQTVLLSLYATIDMGIHYDGWTPEDTTAFLGKYGITDKDIIESIYELIIEEPSHYLKYYIGYLEFMELRKKVQKDYGDDYSNRSFHQAVIQIGPAPFYILEDYIKDYYSPKI